MLIRIEKGTVVQHFARTRMIASIVVILSARLSPSRPTPGPLWRRALIVAASICLIGFAVPAHAKTNVLTQHGDTMRTGWNNQETSLTPSSVGSSLRLQETVSLDEQVDAQPLVAYSQTVENASGVTTVVDVVYVVTENSSIYVLNAANGQQLLYRHFGTPVPATVVPCSSNGSAHIGITSTPVLDHSTNTMYVMVYTYEGNPAAPVFRIHAISMSTLSDKVSPVVVSAGDTLTDDSTYYFDALHSRQRSALLETGGVIYAAFSSYCDRPSNVSRGWLMGWRAGSLTPLPAKELTNRNGLRSGPSFLTSIWMSGNGPAADQSGDLFFVTGNSDKSGTTYNDDNNLAESVVRISSDLTDVRGYFTPSDNSANASGTGLKALDKVDNDLGSGGVLVLPTQAGSEPHLAAAGGKDGHLYLLNRDNLGGYNPNGANRVLGTYFAGQCWCAPSYFVGSDGVGRVVTSGGNLVRTWRVRTSGSPALVAEYTSSGFGNVQDPGFFTSITSNGTSGGAIIWAVTRPDSNSNPTLTLRAFDPANGLRQIFSAGAGPWPNTGGNANIVPTVVNGKVYVGSYKKLSIFGLGE